MELKKVTKLCKLAIQIFVHGVETLLQLALSLLADGVVGGVVVNVGKKYSLGKRWSDVFTRAAVAMAASADL
jgi:hypothetical protein